MKGIWRAGIVLAVALAAMLAGTVKQSQAAPQQATVVPVAANAVATVLLQTVVGGFKDEAISAGFGQLLSFIGLDAEPSATAAQVAAIDARVERVEKAIAQVNVTVSETKRSVDAARLDLESIKGTTLDSAYSAAASQAADIVAKIDRTLSRIRAANAAPITSRGDVTRSEAANAVSDLEGEAERLQAIVFEDPRGLRGTPLIQLAYNVATGNDFLTHRESVHIRYLVGLYTTYEALAAAITVEYRESLPGYSASSIKAYADGWVKTIKAQEAGRRDAVPDRAVVDARTLRMWSIDLGRTRSPASRDAVGGPGGYKDWSIPSLATYQALVTGYKTTAKAFLQNHGFGIGTTNTLISSDRKDYTACRPGFSSYGINANPPTVGTAYGADLGGCNPGTHNGATTYEVCRNVRAGKGGTVRRCQTRTDEQQVIYNARQFGSDHPYFAVRKVPVGSFLPSNVLGTP